MHLVSRETRKTVMIYRQSFRHTWTRCKLNETKVQLGGTGAALLSSTRRAGDGHPNGGGRTSRGESWGEERANDGRPQLGIATSLTLLVTVPPVTKDYVGVRGFHLRDYLQLLRM